MLETQTSTSEFNPKITEDTNQTSSTKRSGANRVMEVKKKTSSVMQTEDQSCIFLIFTLLPLILLKQRRQTCFFQSLKEILQNCFYRKVCVWNSCEVIIYNLSEPAGPRSPWRWWRATRRRFSPCWPCSVTVRGVCPLLFQISLKYRRSPQPVSFSHESWFPWRPPGQRGTRRCPRRREQLSRLSSLQ